MTLVVVTKKLKEEEVELEKVVTAAIQKDLPKDHWDQTQDDQVIIVLAVLMFVFFIIIPYNVYIFRYVLQTRSV